MNSVKTFSIVALIILLILLGSSFYTIQEGSNGLLMRLGKILQSSNGQALIEQPGLHVKFPFIDSVSRIDTRLQTDSATSSRIYIKKDTYFVVQYYLKWRVTDLANFYTATNGSVAKAEKLMQQKINNTMRADFSRRTLPEIISEQNGSMMQNLREQVTKSIANLGIKVVDLRLTAIELPEAVKSSLYDSMIAGWETVANQNRANGERVAQRIKADADGARIRIIAEAKRTAQFALAKGRAQAAEIYTNAYQKDPGFYSFYRSLLAYQDVFDNQKNILVLSPDGDFFRYFNHINGGKNKE